MSLKNDYNQVDSLKLCKFPGSIFLFDDIFIKDEKIKI